MISVAIEIELTSKTAQPAPINTAETMTNRELRVR